MFCGSNSLTNLSFFFFKIKNKAQFNCFPSNFNYYTRIIDSEYKHIFYNFSDTCNDENNIIIDLKNKNCIKSCNNTKYEYYNICLDECPNDIIKNNIICDDIKNNNIEIPDTKNINYYVVNTQYNSNDKISKTDTNKENTMEIHESSLTTQDQKEVEYKDIDTFREYIFDFDIDNKESQKDKIKEDKNIVYQLTNTYNQKNNTYKNITSINLGDCEKILKNKYGLNETLPLIIFKIDYYPPGSLIPKIAYEIYNPLNKTKMDLSHCKDIFVQLNIPVSIDENMLFKYDPNSGFYMDNCFSYTTENGTDMILNDRKKEFSENNYSLCENNCNYSDYNQINKQSTCNCNVKNELISISEIISQPIKLANNFNSDEINSDSGLISSNIMTIKCTKALFSKDGLKSNISSYILIIFIFLFLLSIILFMKCGYHLLEEDIITILKEKEKIEKQNKIKKQELTTVASGFAINKIKSKNNKNRKKRKEVNFPPKKFNLKFINNININKKNNIKLINQNGNIFKRKLNNKNKRNKKHKSKINITSKGKLFIKLTYNDYELNTFSYKNALFYDKRTFCQYYFYLFRIKNILLFSFCPIKDYNLMIIKICIFYLSFSTYYAVNFAFFNDKMIHKIYEEGGKYDIIFFLPTISISFAISYVITIIIKLIFLSERNLVKIRVQPTYNIANNISSKEKRNIVIKYIIFFILGTLFLTFFWFILSAFGAVYQNTQIYIFENSLISFGMSLFYPIFISIFPCIFRIASLNSQNKNSECSYNFSKFLQIL